MGIVLVALFLSCIPASLVGFGVAYITYLVRRPEQRRFNLNVAIPVTILTSIFFLWPAMHVVQSLTEDQLFGVAPREANAALQFLEVPTGASDVNLYSAPMRVLECCDFKMTEADFLLWVETQDWTPRQFATREHEDWPRWVGRQRTGGEGESADVEILSASTVASKFHLARNGYYFSDAIEPDFSGITVVYDRDTKRVYFEHSGGI